MTVTCADINQKTCLERVLETQPQIAHICSTIDQSILEYYKKHSIQNKIFLKLLQIANN